MAARWSGANDAVGDSDTNGRRRALLELAVGYGLILLVIWSARPWQRVFYCAAAFFLVAVLWISFDSWSVMGLRKANFWRSLWAVGVALVLAATAIEFSRHMGAMHPVGGPVEFVQRYWGYALWSLAQQILLLDFFLPRFQRLLTRPGNAVLAAAGIFAAAHLPNPVLTVVTLIFGAAACLIFLHYRNLWPLAIAHAILGVTIALTGPAPVIRSMRVGLGYLTYEPHRVHGLHGQHRPRGRPQRSHMDQTVSTQVWVIAEAATRRS